MHSMNRSTRLLASARPFSTSARVRGTASTATSRVAFVEAREEAEEYCRKHGWDMGSLVEQSIVWGDHDAFNHVNNVRYVRFFETGRMQFARSLLPELPPGSEESLVRGKPGSVGVILASISAKYKRPVTYPDTLLVAHRVTSVTKDRFALDQICYSYAQRAVVTTGSSDMVTYGYGALKKMDMSPELAAALKRRLK